MSANRSLRLYAPKFIAYLIAQSLGALNDNAFRFLVSIFAATAGLNLLSDTTDSSLYLTLTMIVFTAPFLLFVGWAGTVADRFDKRRLIIYIKIAEVIIMAAAAFALISQNIMAMLVALFFMSTQSAFFAPVKYGILPEIFSKDRLAGANGLVQLSTFIAIITGTVVGGFLSHSYASGVYYVAAGYIGIALLGFIASLFTPSAQAVQTIDRVSANPWSEIRRGLPMIWQTTALKQSWLGIGFIWFSGSLLTLLIVLHAKQVLGQSDVVISFYNAALALGLGLGGVVAAKITGKNLEVGHVPLWAFVLFLLSVVLLTNLHSTQVVIGCMFGMGLFGGMFVVPLLSLFQHTAPHEKRGRLLAVSSFYNMLNVLLASAVMWLCYDVLSLNVPQIIILYAGLCLLVSIAFVKSLGRTFYRYCLGMWLKLVYRLQVLASPVKADGIIYVVNLISSMQILSLFLKLPENTVFVLPQSSNKRWYKYFADVVDAKQHKDIIALHLNGCPICFFPEGQPSQLGHMHSFHTEFIELLAQLAGRVQPIYTARFNKKNWLYAGVTIPVTKHSWKIRQALQQTSAQLFHEAIGYQEVLSTVFIRTAKRLWWRPWLADSTGKNLTFLKALTGALVFQRWLDKNASRQNRIGILLPATTTAAIINIATLLSGRVPINLNFTAGLSVCESSARQANARMILTSRAFLNKLDWQQTSNMVFLEDVAKGLKPGLKIISLLKALFVPGCILRYFARKRWLSADDVATVLFSSGTTGIPKGVMLTHRQLLANIASAFSVVDINGKDRFLGILPLFHSFGFLATLCAPMKIGYRVVYHPNPLDAKTIGQLAQEHGTTCLITTPTFCRTYIERIEAEQFKSLKTVITGAEKLPGPLAQRFKDKFGVTVFEGYGCTELGPAVAVNQADVVQGDQTLQTGHKPGTIGHPMPGVAVKIVDENTGKALGVDKPGMLMVQSAATMQGYLDRPDLTAEAMKQGWYTTGDIAQIDDGGFIKIVDRLARFSKIGGEMVPHLRLETLIAELIGEGQAMVTAVPDKKKGESLVVLLLQDALDPDALYHKLQAADLPKLWLPKKEHILTVEVLPVTGTGKLDLRQAKQIAVQQLSL